MGDGRRRRWKNDESDESRGERGKDGELGADMVGDEVVVIRLDVFWWIGRLLCRTVFV